ncbi:MAG: 4'-phosphopantetheinyl transferase family protein [Bryobacteraceae bacterium]
MTEELAPELIARARRQLLHEPAPVHIWLWRTDIEAFPAEVLSASERAAAARFRFPRDRIRATSSRAGLRWLLGGYLGVPPESLVFAAGAGGKPCLAGAGAVSFNLSHSGIYTTAAVSRNREVGIDLERIRPDAAGRDIAARFFSGEERAWLDATPGVESFFRLWTAKEAVLKAMGTGLSTPLNRLSVRPGQDAPPWNLRELDLAPDYASAVAFDGPPVEPEVMGA